MYETHGTCTDDMALVMNVQTRVCIFGNIKSVLEKMYSIVCTGVDNRVTKGNPEVYVPDSGR